MNRIFFVGVAISAFLMAGCASSVRVFHDMDTATDFSKYNSYNFLEWTEGNLKSINQLEREKIKTAFARELESHGLVYKPDGADLSVQITVYHREKKQFQSTYPYYPYYSPYYYGYGPRVYNYLERAIAVDIYDNEIKKHIWHSAAVGELDNNPQKREERLPLIADKMLRDFPKQKTGEI